MIHEVPDQRWDSKISQSAPCNRQTIGKSTKLSKILSNCNNTWRISQWSTNAWKSTNNKLINNKMINNNWKYKIKSRHCTNAEWNIISYKFWCLNRVEWAEIGIWCLFWLSSWRIRNKSLVLGLSWRIRNKSLVLGLSWKIRNKSLVLKMMLQP